MNCERSQEMIDEKVQGTLDAAGEAELNEHLAACAVCRKELAALTRTRELLRLLPAQGPDTRTLAATWHRIDGRVGHMGAGTLVIRGWMQNRLVSAGALAALLLIGAWLIGQHLSGGASILGGTRQVAAQYDAARRPASSAPASDPFLSHISPPSERNAKERWNDGSAVGLVAKDEATAALAALPNRPPAGKESLNRLAEGPIRDMDDNARESDAGRSMDKRLERAARQPGDAPKPMKPPQLGQPARGPEDLGGPPKAPVSQKIIKTADLTVEVRKYDEASQTVANRVAEFGGFVADSRVTQDPDGTSRGRITVRVPCEKFEALYAELRKLGRIESENVRGQDVTAEYTDLESRLKNCKITEERLQDLIKSKTILDNIAKLLEVEREIARVRGEIESMQGQKRVMDDRISLSTINLVLHEKSRVVPGATMSVEVKSLDEAWGRLSAALTQTQAHIRQSSVFKRADGSLQGSYTIRVALPHFAGTAAEIEKLGRVEQREMNGQALGAMPEGAASVNCDIALVLFERSRTIPSGQVNIETGNLQEAQAKLETVLAKVEGRVISSSVQHRTDGTSAANMRVQVSLGKFEALVRALDAIGRVDTTQLQGQEFGDVVGGAASVPCELALSLYESGKQIPNGRIEMVVENYKESAKRFEKALAQHKAQLARSQVSTRPDLTWSASYDVRVPAGTVDALIADIEGLGQVRSKAVQGVGLTEAEKPSPNVIGNLSIVIDERSALTPGPDRAGSPLRRAVHDGLSALYASVAVVSGGLIVLGPWALVIALVVLGVKRYMRRGKGAQGAGPSAPPAAPEAPKGTGK